MPPLATRSIRRGNAAPEESSFLEEIEYPRRRIRRGLVRRVDDQIGIFRDLEASPTGQTHPARQLEPRPSYSLPEPRPSVPGLTTLCSDLGGNIEEHLEEPIGTDEFPSRLPVVPTGAYGHAYRHAAMIRNTSCNEGLPTQLPATVALSRDLLDLRNHVENGNGATALLYHRRQQASQR